MKPAPIAARDLIHLNAQGALGTVLADAPGQPFVSAIEFAPDAENAPVFLVSRLAEHTKNLERDPRASLLLTAPPAEGGLLAQARMTLVGEARRFEPDDELVTRFLRYLPDAEQYLALGDFGFFRLQVARIRLIGGFGSPVPRWRRRRRFRPRSNWTSSRRSGGMLRRTCACSA